MPASMLEGVLAVKGRISQLKFLWSQDRRRWYYPFPAVLPISPKDPRELPSAYVRAIGHTNAIIVSQILEIGRLASLTELLEGPNMLVSIRGDRAIPIESI